MRRLNMSDHSHLSRVIEQLLGQHWLLSFRVETAVFLVLSFFCVPDIIKELSGVSRSTRRALAGIMFFYALLLCLRASPHFGGVSEEWEELNLARMVLGGEMGSFKALFRHGTTWPFLLADWFRVAGASPAAVMLLNILQSICIPVLLFVSSRLLFRSDMAALLSAVLFAAWPETVRYTALTYGKTAFMMFGMSVFLAVFAAAFRFGKPAVLTLLFLAADLAAKTRQEFAVLYLVAALLWVWKAPKTARWLIPLMAVLTAFYYPLFVRGVACHIMPRPGTYDFVPSLIAQGESFPWLLLVSCGIIGAAFLIRKEFRSGKAWAGPALAALLLNTVYFIHPAGFQARLSAQALPALLVLLGRAVFCLPPPRRRRWVYAALSLLAVHSWTGGVTGLFYGDAGAALARFYSVRGSLSSTVVFDSLETAAQWSFSGFRGEYLLLSSIIAGNSAEEGGEYPRVGRILSGRTVWLVYRPQTGDIRVHGWEDAVSGRAKKTGEYLAGGWQMNSYVFAGTRNEPWLSKAASDRAVNAWLKGDMAEAEKSLKEALSFDPGNPDALRSYAAVKELAGDAAGCAELLERAVALNGPGMPGTKGKSRERCLSKSGRK